MSLAQIQQHLLLNILCFVHMVVVITCFGEAGFGFAQGFALLGFRLVCLSGLLL